MCKNCLFVPLIVTRKFTLFCRAEILNLFSDMSLKLNGFRH